MPTIVNLASIQKKMGASKSVKRRLAQQEIHPRLKVVQEDMLQNFEDHPVTREIDGGPYSPNLSGTLSGVEDGNLFSFLGFYSGEDPIQTIRDQLSRPISIRKIQHISGRRFKVTIQGLPDKKTIFSMTPLPWASGRSWIDGIEHGVAGFGGYLILSPRKQPSKSRSGVALQSKGSVRRGGFKNAPYLSQILLKFQQNLRNLNAIPV